MTLITTFERRDNCKTVTDHLISAYEVQQQIKCLAANNYNSWQRWLQLVSAHLICAWVHREVGGGGAAWRDVRDVTMDEGGRGGREGGTRPRVHYATHRSRTVLRAPAHSTCCLIVVAQ